MYVYACAPKCVCALEHMCIHTHVYMCICVYVCMCVYAPVAHVWKMTHKNWLSPSTLWIGRLAT